MASTLAQRITRCDTVEDIKRELGQFGKTRPGGKGSESIEHDLGFLLEYVAVNWLSLFNEEEKQRYFVDIFQSVNKATLFLVAYRILAQKREKQIHSFVVETVLHLLQTIIFQPSYNLCQQVQPLWAYIIDNTREYSHHNPMPSETETPTKSQTKTPTEIGKSKRISTTPAGRFIINNLGLYVINAVADFPNQLLAKIAKVPSRFSAKTFYRSFLKGIPEDSTPKQRYVVGFVASKLTRIGSADTVVDALGKDVLKYVDESVEEIVIEKLMLQVLKSFSAKDVRTILEGPIASSKRMERMLYHKFLLVNVIPLSILHKITYFIAEQNAIVPVLKDISHAWASPSFVRHSAIDQHRYMTQAISSLLEKLISCSQSTEEAKQKLEGSESLTYMIKGVQLRLISQINEVRLLGMRVARDFSRVLSPDEVIQFDELVEEDKREHQQQQKEAAAEAADAKREADEKKKEEEEEKAQGRDHGDDRNDEHAKADTKHQKKTVDPDAPWNEGDETDSDLSAYSDLEDGDLETLKTVKPPVYIRDCLEYLWKADDNDKGLDHVESALQVLPAIIRSKPHDLASISVPLAGAIFRVTHLGSLQDEFLTFRDSALVALIVACPDTVAPYFTNMFYSDNQTMGERIEVLDFLAKAANEMAKLKPVTGPQENKAPLPQQKKQQQQQAKDQQQQEQKQGIIVEDDDDDEEEDDEYMDEKAKKKRAQKKPMELVGKVTRRWGQRKSALPTTGVNEFVKYVDLFFFGLTSKVNNSENTFDLFKSDPCVLARLLAVLAVFVECATNSQALSRMSSNLFDLLWATRQHNDAAVRRNSLYCYSKVMLTVPEFILSQDFLPEMNELVTWLLENQGKESDEAIRELSILCVSMVKKIFEGKYQPRQQQQ